LPDEKKPEVDDPADTPCAGDPFKRLVEGFDAGIKMESRALEDR
jgi:hypothetical protein